MPLKARAWGTENPTRHKTRLNLIHAFVFIVIPPERENPIRTVGNARIIPFKKNQANEIQFQYQ
jgi:hypothetical protein